MTELKYTPVEKSADEFIGRFFICLDPTRPELINEIIGADRTVQDQYGVYYVSTDLLGMIPAEHFRQHYNDVNSIENPRINNASQAITTPLSISTPKQEVPLEKLILQKSKKSPTDFMVSIELQIPKPRVIDMLTEDYGIPIEEIAKIILEDNLEIKEDINRSLLTGIINFIEKKEW